MDLNAIGAERCESLYSRPRIPHRKRLDGLCPDAGARFEREQYRRRNVVERLIGRLKEFLRIAT